MLCAKSSWHHCPGLTLPRVSGILYRAHWRQVAYFTSQQHLGRKLSIMYIRKCERRAIYRALFENGVLVAFKDHHPKRMHRELKWVPNLHVIKIMQSLLSRKLVTEIYSWNWYYWTLTNDGIIYLRTYLHISDHLLPSTLISRVRVVPIVVPKDGGFPDPRSADDRGIFRRLGPKEGSSHKRDNVGPGTDNLEFRGGYGRMA